MDDAFIIEFQRSFGRLEQKVDNLKEDGISHTRDIRMLSERLGNHERAMAERSRRLSDSNDVLIASSADLAKRVVILEAPRRQAEAKASERARRRRRVAGMTAKVVGVLSTAALMVWALVEPVWHATAEHVTRSFLDHRM